LKTLQNLQGLRKKLKPVPTLPPDKAALFLTGNAGDAWPVPDKNGIFVLALLADKNLCAVYARRANIETATRLFNELVTFEKIAKAP
jgi:hypothetical protein